MDVRDGIIGQVRFFGDYFGMLDSEEIEQALAGIPHREDSIRETLRPFDLGKYITNLTVDELMQGLF
jgi:lipoate-protein ligase A